MKEIGHAKDSSSSGSLSGAVEVVPSGNFPVFPESAGGEDAALKAPDISSGSLDVILAASDLLEAVSSAANLEPEPALFDSAAGQLVCDGELASGEMVPDVGEVICSSESSASVDEDEDDDDESLKLGDSSCPSVEPYYFAKAPSKSFSKRFGNEVSRHDIAFVRGSCHMRTVVDRYQVQKHKIRPFRGLKQVSDPARPDVPLWIEFTAVYGEEKVEPGTALKLPNESLMPWIFMRNSNRVGGDVNIQFF